VSEAAPGLPDSPNFATPERARLAEAVRLLIDAVMTNEGDDPALLIDVAAEAELLARRLGSGRADGPGYAPRSHGDYLPRSPVVGEASPLAPRIDWELTDDAIDGRPGVEAHGVFGAPYEGPPGHVHGGMVAMVLDHVLGEVAASDSDRPRFTGTLTIRYLRATPLGDLHAEGRITRTDGIKAFASGHVSDAEGITAEAEGVFILPKWARS
jgi:hypothetical protein